MITHLKDSLLYIVLFIFIFIAGFSDAAERPVKVGISGGQTRVKNNNTQQYQDAIHIGVTVGAQVVDTPSATAGVEAKYSKTTAKENVTDTNTATTSQYEEETKGLYLTVRNKGSVYLKGKIGAANRTVTTDNAVLVDTTKASAGIGLGIVTAKGSIMELEYTQYDRDVSVVSVGYLF